MDFAQVFLGLKVSQVDFRVKENFTLYFILRLFSGMFLNSHDPTNRQRFFCSKKPILHVEASPNKVNDVDINDILNELFPLKVNQSARCKRN